MINVGAVTSIQKFDEYHPWVASLSEPLAREYEFFVDAQRGVERVLTGTYGAELTKYVYGTAIGGTRDRPRLIAWVANDGDIQYEWELVTSVTGLGVDEVDVIPTKPFTNAILTGMEQTICGWRNNRYRPVPVGCGVMGRTQDCSYLYGQPSGCSLGFIAIDSHGNIGVVSANHCFSGSVCNVGPGYYVVQPDDVCGGSCPSDVIADHVYTKDYGGGTWVVDAAFAIATTPIQYAYLSDQRSIPFPGPTRSVAPQLGMSIVKFGRGIFTYSTGSTTIGSINGTINVSCPNGVMHTFSPVFGFGNTISPGDSGSGSYVQGTLQPVGLNFAGNLVLGFDVYATLIEKELGITLLTAPPSITAVTATTTPLSTLALITAGVAGAVLGVGLAMYVTGSH